MNPYAAPSMSVRLYYRPGYKYQASRNYAHSLPWYKGPTVRCPFVTLYSTGLLVVHAGYAWDGPSGPTFDTRAFMRGALVHDALYQLIREGLLAAVHRLDADRELWACCRADGMWLARAVWVYVSVRWFAGFAARRGSDGDHPELTAP